MIADELIRSCQLESWIIQAKKEVNPHKQRGFTNVIVVTGGEGPCDGSVYLHNKVSFSYVKGFSFYWIIYTIYEHSDSWAYSHSFEW